MKTNSYFIRAKLYPLERIVGSFKFRGRRCEACLNVTETETFTTASTNQNYKIKHKFSCNESSPIHLLTCRSVASNILYKQLLFFAVDGIIIKLMTESVYNLSQSPFGFGFFTSPAVWNNLFHPLENIESLIVFRRCPCKNVFWKHTANLQENIHAKLWFQQSCKETLLKSPFGMGFLL